MQHHIRTSRRSSRAFIFADALLGLALVSVLATVLTIAAHRHARASRALADSRAAVRLAEEVAVQLQAGKAIPASATETSIRIVDLGAAGHTTNTTWVEITTHVRRGQARLITCIPQTKSGQPGEPKP